VFDRFSDEAKRAMNLARQAAQSTGCDRLDDEHMLIGSCQTPGSLAARVLLACGQDPVEVCARAEVRAARMATGARDDGQLPFTPLAKKVLELTLEEAGNAGHRWLGTHHVLLGVLRSGGTAAEGLRAGGLSLLDARKAARQVHESARPAGEQATVAPKDRPNLQLLRGAIAVCMDLQEFELAESLWVLVERLESSP
jgi:ATP-dependent Clp protease ATP-binding subunit ClpC